jgi:hypothetical protein
MCADVTRQHRGKRNKLTQEQRNQRNALKYFIRITAFEDDLEIVNTCTESDNQWFLKETFGMVDSQVPPCYAFDGCVIVDKRLR